MERRSDIEEQFATGPMIPEDEWEALPDQSPIEPSTSLPPAAATFTDTYYRAGFWLRLIAFTIDAVILGVFSLVLLIFGALLTTPGGELNDLDFAMNGSLSLLSLWCSATIIAGAAYFTILHSEHGQTIGKSLLRLEVRTPDGEAVSYSQALLRWLAYGVSALFFGLGFLWVALNPGKRGWHDLLANTVVVARKEEE